MTEDRGLKISSKKTEYLRLRDDEDGEVNLQGEKFAVVIVSKCLSGDTDYGTTMEAIWYVQVLKVSDCFAQ
ncbi:hypothetical protein SK128_001620 [Halocaridina rubra]|uniref:Uncharacterized protein n=1 Tax=Halocaridina rubra TaxID=373956 RepID=A0AAN8XDA4_HALRR